MSCYCLHYASSRGLQIHCAWLPEKPALKTCFIFVQRALLHLPSVFFLPAVCFGSRNPFLLSKSCRKWLFGAAWWSGWPVVVRVMFFSRSGISEGKQFSKGCGFGFPRATRSLALTSEQMAAGTAHKKTRCWLRVLASG